MLYVIAWIGVVISALMFLTVVIGGAICAFKYVRAAISKKELLPTADRGDEWLLVTGATYVLVLIVLFIVNFCSWSITTVFGG